MNNEQIVDELDSLLTLLNEQQKEIEVIHKKFQVALTGVLRLVGETPTLTNLHGKTENLKGYLIQLSTDVIETTTKSHQNTRKKIEEVIELASPSDRKS